VWVCGRWGSDVTIEGSFPLVVPGRAAEPTIRFDLCREQDVRPLMRFIDAEWQAGHVLSRDEELLRWQFDGSLLPGREFAGPTVILAWHDDAIVGMFGLTACQVTLEGTLASGVWLSHWFASPKYRRYNVALGLWRAVEEFGFETIGTVGANQASTKLLSAMRFETIPALPRWLGVVNVSQTARLLVDCNQGLTPDDAVHLCERYRAESGALGPAAAEAAVEVTPWRDEFATAWDHYWKEHVARTIVGTVRDARFLRWRYIHHPRFRYEIRLATGRSDGRVTGLAVFRLEQVRGRNETVLRVVEFLASPPASAALARAILQAGREFGVAYADFYCSSASVARGLEEVGFRPVSGAEDQSLFPTRLQPLEGGRHDITALVRLPSALRGQLNALVRAGRLYLTKSDGDQDRPN